MAKTPTDDEDDTAPVTSVPGIEDMEKRTRQYLQVRQALKELDERQAAERKPLQDVQELLTGKIRKFMDDNRLENLKTSAGTCYTSTRYTATVADPAAFMDFVTTRGLWDLIERRANSTAVRDYVKDHNHLPAGVNLNGLQTLGVRSPTGKKKT